LTGPPLGDGGFTVAGAEQCTSRRADGVSVVIQVDDADDAVR